jgi:hypothetical protein
MAWGLLRVTNHPELWVIRVSRSRITHVGPSTSLTAWLSAAHLSSASRCEALRGSRPYLGFMPPVSGPVARPVADAATTAMLEQLTFDTTFLTVGGVDADAGYTEYELDDAETKKAALRSARGRS